VFRNYDVEKMDLDVCREGRKRRMENLTYMKGIIYRSKVEEVGNSIVSTVNGDDNAGFERK
jgi:hypothetical protein